MAHAAWRENRDGELFFVEADSTAAGWAFSERSTYEVCWYKVQPKDGWLEKAEAIGATPRPCQAAESQVELGDYCDNASALAIAVWKMKQGEVEQGLSMLNVLRTHIVGTSDEKSRRLLLPAVEEAIEKEFRRQTGAQRMADSNGTPRGPSAAAPAFAGVGAMAGHPSGDMVSRFKLHMIDVVAIVTALAWTHTMLVHEINTLPGLAAHPAGANVVAGSVLAVVLRLVSKTARD